MGGLFPVCRRKKEEEKIKKIDISKGVGILDSFLFFFQKYYYFMS